MTTDATRIRDAIAERLGELPGYVMIRKTPVPQLQPEQMPALSVFIVGETLMPDGDANVGEPRFQAAITIGISDARGFNHPTVLDGSMDTQVDLIERTLLCDPTFVRFGNDPRYVVGDWRREPFFEAVTKIERQRVMPGEGETYFAELRLAITFMTRVGFEPLITDAYERTVLTARVAGSGEHTPSLTVVVDQAQ